MNDAKEAPPNVEKLAILIAELQRDVMDMGKHLGIVMQRLQSIDFAAGQRLSRLEQAQGVPLPQPSGSTAKVVDFKLQQVEKAEE